MRRPIFIALIIIGCSAKPHQEPSEYYSSDVLCDPSPALPNDLPADRIFHYSEEESTCDSNTYKLQIDRRFLCDPEEEVLLAWKNWAAILQSHPQVIVQYPEQIQDSFERCTIKVLRKITPPQNPGITTAHLQDNGKPSAARIFLDPVFQGMVLKLAAEHEFGHALGLGHVDWNPHDIMAGTTDDPRLQTITCYDKKKLCEIWGCDPGCNE